MQSEICTLVQTKYCSKQTVGGMTQQLVCVELLLAVNNFVCDLRLLICIQEGLI